jgi:periplasmic mercuric ion binding protein
MKRFSLLLTLLSFFLFHTTEAIATDGRTATASYLVSIHCGSCEAKLTEHLRFERGVKDINIDVAKKKVEISYNPRRTDADQLGKAIEKLGYEVRLYPTEEEVNVTTTEGGCCTSRKDSAHTCAGKKEGASGCCSSKKEGAHTCAGKKEGSSGCCSSKKTSPEGATGTDSGATHSHKGSCNHGSR